MRGVAQMPAHHLDELRIALRGPDGDELGDDPEDKPGDPQAQAETERPSLIVARTIIAWPAPNAQNTEAAHGSALGEAEVAATKKVLGFDPEQHFQVEDEVLTHARRAAERGHQAHAEWTKRFEEWRAANPERAAEFDRISAGELPEGWERTLPVFEAGKSVATRKASGEVLKALGAVVPELWGGSADLAGSNNTTIDASSSFLPEDNPLPEASPYGRTVHFGIREHAMGSTMNGIALHGNTRIYGGTFLVFSDYMRPAVRLAALMKLPVTYVWTHDSIGLGEDGPTHQPIEHLASLRYIPDNDVWRPCDAVESAVSWKAAIERADGPSCLVFSRQNLPHQPRDAAQVAAIARGGYVLKDSAGTPELILIATGSEVDLAMRAAAQLGDKVRVVSMPSTDVFDRQDAAYRESVLPKAVRKRVAIEAGVTDFWRKYVGLDGAVVGIDSFGASAPIEALMPHFGFTVDKVVAAAKSL